MGDLHLTIHDITAHSAANQSLMHSLHKLVHDYALVQLWQLALGGCGSLAGSSNAVSSYES